MRVESESEAFHLFITDDMSDTIIQNTNKHARDAQWRDLDKQEFDAVFVSFSYVPKRNPSVVLLSSMHHSHTVDIDSGKPEIILFYNETKGAVDTIDQL